MNKPLVSIVTVVYNSEFFLRSTIQSVISQTYNKTEFIIIDGGSTDGTVDCIKNYDNHIDFWISEGDEGIYDAMNKAVAHCNGDFIIFMNAGDCFAKDNVLDVFVDSIFKQDSWADIYYGNIILEINNRLVIRRPMSLNQLMYRMPFCHQAVFCSRKLLEDNKFSDLYELASDFLFFREAYLSNAKFVYLDFNVCNYDLNGVSISRYQKYLREMFRIIISSERTSIIEITRSLFGLLRVNSKFMIKYFTFYLINRIRNLRGLS